MAMIESTTLLVLAILALIAASYGYYWYSPAPPLPPLSATIRKNGVRAGGRDRSYLLYVPVSLPPRAALVIVLHGSGMDGTRMRICTGYQFDCLADQLGFVVLYPDGYRRNWNDCRKDATFPAKRENIDDMSFIRALIARAMAEQAIDEKRIYVFGYSNGGHMAFRLAMEAPNQIAAAAAVAASLPTPDASSCPRQGRTSRVMLINGTLDPINPYQGGIVTLFGFASRGSVMSSVASAQSLAERNGISMPPIPGELRTSSSDDTTSVETLTWQADGTPFCCLYTVRGGGHVIPQPAYRFPRLLGKTTSVLNSPREAIRFFDSRWAGESVDALSPLFN
jgi:polyhydroxybutyrate depolymerase